jgi:hypothetical protein
VEEVVIEVGLVPPDAMIDATSMRDEPGEPESLGEESKGERKRESKGTVMQTD